MVPHNEADDMMADNLTPYAPSDKMRTLIADNSQILMTLSRFGIPLGFGDRTVGEVCKMHDIHTPTFLAVANFMSRRPVDDTQAEALPLMRYLQRAHDYYLDFQLPMIRRKLIEAVDISDPDGFGFLILRFFDEYTQEVRRHMEMENRRVFPYVKSLLDNFVTDGNFSISEFGRHHEAIAPKMKELKDIVVRYYPGKGGDMLNSVLFDLITCERDLHLHCEVEDTIFVNVVRRLEQQALLSPRQQLPDKKESVNIAPDSTDAEKIASLSDREKEIVVNIARGLSNKEIADRLCLSVHTVTTHRRNISQKLDIHSPAGLTIFAIVNSLIPLTDIPRPR